MEDDVIVIKTGYYQVLVYKSMQLDLVKKIVASFALSGSYDMAKMLKTLFRTDVPTTDRGGEE